MGRLPSGFQELSYIESTGTQWIDTWIVPANKIISAVIDGISLDGENNPITGAYVRDNDNNWQIGTLNNQWRVKINNQGFYAGTADTLRHIFRANANDGWWVDSFQISGSQFVTVSSASNPIRLFGRSNDDHTVARVFSAKYYDNAVLIRDFIPCRRLSDNAIGMHDLVSQSFFGNSGTGSFIAGAPVIEPTWGIGLAQVTQKEMLARRFVITPRKLWLYRDGDECVSVTGGWGAIDTWHQEGNVYTKGTYSKNSNSLTVRVERYGNVYQSEGFAASKMIDITNFRKLCIVVTDKTNVSGVYTPVQFSRTTKRRGQSFIEENLNPGQNELNISAYTGLAYLSFGALAFDNLSVRTRTLTVSEIWLE